MEGQPASGARPRPHPPLFVSQVPFGQQAIFLRKGADVTAYVRKNLSQVTMWKCETSQ